MKIRKKITIWIAGTALVSTISFSLFIVVELVEQHFQLIDKELQYMADAVIKARVDHTGAIPTIDVSSLPYNIDHYWVRITDSKKSLLYQSPMTADVDLGVYGEKEKYSVEQHIPREQIWLGQDDNDDVMFRVRRFHSFFNNEPIQIIIAVPIEDIEEEYILLLKEYAAAVVLAILLIIFVSYILSGKILQPVSSISAMAREISDESLGKRIPLGRSKDEFYDLSIALNRMFDRLQHSFVRQKEFIGNASHELKSPLTLLKIAQEELLINYDLAPSLKNNLERQLKTIHRMSRLVRDLLDLSRLQQLDKIVPVQVDLTVLVEKVLDDYSDLLHTQNIIVRSSLAGKMCLNGDYEKLQRLLVNLIDNSIRYNLPNEGLIKINGSSKDGMLVLELLNVSLPIPENELERILEQFYRVEKSRAIACGGTGLGLTIAKEIVVLHGGSIKITNEAGGFVKVTISLPGINNKRNGSVS